MKKCFLRLAFAALLLLPLASCTKEDPIPEVTFDKKVLIINQGNYSEQSASISLFDENTMQITNRIYESANGISIGATIVSGVVSPDKEAYLVCNNPDKIEIIEASTGKLKSTVTEGLESPRNVLIAGEMFFVSNWGYNHIVNDAGWWEFNESYISVYDTKTKTLMKKFLVGTDAEGMALYGNRLFVAVKEGIKVIDISNASFSTVSVIRAPGFTGGAKHIAFDKNYNLWVSFPDKGLVQIDPVSLAVVGTVTVPVDGMDGFIIADKTGQKIYTYQTKFNANYQPEEASIYSVDVTTKTYTKFFAGTYFYGVGASPSTGNLFTAEVSFTSNSLLKVVGTDGILKTSASAGIGTCRYLFF
ncbi:MAG: hypothetical protein LLF93_09350 [Bacteroidales bacterium]|nr:hypothetical protein [Bacteroidales bacterium]